VTLFWTPITAFVGALTNINYLTDRVSFLSFIDDIPDVILGVVTGLLPTLILSLLVVLFPIFCRLLAKTAGAITLSEVELKTQSWYFIFQVIQVFLITTFSSGAAAVTTQIINSPTTAPTLLAKNLPKASNFYISYFILYGLLQAALQLLLVAPLLMKTVLGRFLDKTPRKQYNRWTSLAGLGWGSQYPKWTNLGVIALSYAIIAPLVLGFATIGFCILYIAFRHNWLFVFGDPIDMKGEAYARALKQLTTGAYLSSVCLIGLFAIGIGDSTSAIGPLVIMVVFLVVVAVLHGLFDRALAPLEQHLPLDMLQENAASINPDQPGETPKENMLTRRVRPIIHQRFYSKIPQNATESGHLEDDIDPEEAYLNPAIISQSPLIWLPRDDVGASRELVRGNEEKGVKTTDDFAWFDEKSRVVWDTSRAEEIDRIVNENDKLGSSTRDSEKKETVSQPST
jgi:calcium permeable stress-gated cation channel